MIQLPSYNFPILNQLYAFIPDDMCNTSKQLADDSSMTIIEETIDNPIFNHGVTFSQFNDYVYNQDQYNSFHLTCLDQFLNLGVMIYCFKLLELNHPPEALKPFFLYLKNIGLDFWGDKLLYYHNLGPKPNERADWHTTDRNIHQLPDEIRSYLFEET